MIKTHFIALLKNWEKWDIGSCIFRDDLWTMGCTTSNSGLIFVDSATVIAEKICVWWRGLK